MLPCTKHHSSWCPNCQVVGFDMVDDESKPERRPTKHCPPPAEWNSKHNCAYSYYAYYVYANLYVLNKFRCVLSSGQWLGHIVFLGVYS